MCCHRHQSALLQLLVTLDWTPLVHTLMNRHHAGYAQHPQGPICTTELCDSLSLAIQQPAMLGNVLIVSSGGQKKTPKQDKSDQNKSMWFAKDNSDCSSFITMNGLTIQTSFLLFYEYRDDQCFIANRTRLMDPIHQLHSRVCESWKKRKKESCCIFTGKIQMRNICLNNGTSWWLNPFQLFHHRSLSQ